jgi:hypothetical protein
MMRSRPEFWRTLVKTRERVLQIIVSGNRVEQARHAQGVVHTSGGTNQAEASAFSREPSALAHQCADAGAVHLNEAAQIHQHFFVAFAGEPLQFAVKEFAIFAESGAATRFDDDDVALRVRCYFQFWVIGIHWVCDAAILPQVTLELYDAGSRKKELPLCSVCWQDKPLWPRASLMPDAIRPSGTASDVGVPESNARDQSLTLVSVTPSRFDFIRPTEIFLGLFAPGPGIRHHLTEPEI